MGHHPPRESVYDLLRPHLDASDLIARLGLSVTSTSGSEVYCDPLCHDSASRESLQINVQTGRWNCKACQSSGISGDLFQLVEYALSGGNAPSHGAAQRSSSAHTQALIWLCDQFAIPFDSSRITGSPTLDTVHMFAMIAHELLARDPERLKWIEDSWGFDLETVRAYGIGYMPSPLPPRVLTEATGSGMRAAFKASGLGWHSPDGKWHTRFEGRITFPYLEHGRAIYLIGRSTPWTPRAEEGRFAPKYHKLSVHTEKRPWISPAIHNNHLYNETVMNGATEIGVLEGMTDTIAISSIGETVVSPITVSFNATDLKRFVAKCKANRIGRVWILFDNELSGSGTWGARRLALKLVRAGLVSKILTLPLPPKQQAARDDVLEALGPELFAELEQSDPKRRREIIEALDVSDGKREWIVSQVIASKIDAAEWYALMGARAATEFQKLKRAAIDVVISRIEETAKRIDHEASPVERLDAFGEEIELSACIDERMIRDSYSGAIAKAAGKNVSKADVASRVAKVRKAVRETRKQEAEVAQRSAPESSASNLALLPPDSSQASQVPPAPEQPPHPHVPPSPGAVVKDEHERYAPNRIAVIDAIERKVSDEYLGDFVAQTITRSMGYTPFRTPEDLYLVRGSVRIAVGLANYTPEFSELLWLASGVTQKKTSHRSYIAAVIYFLSRGARRVADVSWSHVDGDKVYFPTGDSFGRILCISAGSVKKTRMAEVRVPAVAGEHFLPFDYRDESGGVERAMKVFKWTSMSEGDRMMLVYWIVCLPILRKIGTIPIVRVEGASGSGKTRIVDAASYLVNGRKISSVPTAAAMISRLACEMLTIDDNREAKDVTPALLGTLLQATHLGAREKRKGNSDTGTVIERISGALLMNGVEPIHDGKSEVASRMITLTSTESLRSPSSPSSDADLKRAVTEIRDLFWSDAVRRCAVALDLDRDHGERIGKEIEIVFGSTRIGRLSAYLRMMYFAWVAGLDERGQAFALDALADKWHAAFTHAAHGALESLLDEELSVTVLRYVFDFGFLTAEPTGSGSTEMTAFGGLFNLDTSQGDAYLGPIKANKLARLARSAGKEMNGPRQIAVDLKAGQLSKRLEDGLDFIRSAGYLVDVEVTNKGHKRYSFTRQNFIPPKPQTQYFAAPWERD